MKWLAFALCLFLRVALWADFAQANFTQIAVGGALLNCQTIGTLSCDTNGWTQFAVGPGGFCEGTTGGCASPAANTTRIIYVSTSGNDANAGTFAAPVATPATAKTMVRNGSPDWLLLKCGDTWTDQAFDFVNVGGLNANNPFLISSYDGGAGHNPPTPNPTSCSTQPVIQVSSTWVTGGNSVLALGQNANYSAVVGIKWYAFKRDPSNGAFTLGEAATKVTGLSNFRILHDLLFEDNTIAFFVAPMVIGNSTTVGSGGAVFYNQVNSMFLRRNRIISSYPESQYQDQGILAGSIFNGPPGFVLYENLVDHSGWNIDGGITWAPLNGAFAGRFHNLYLSQNAINDDTSTIGTPPTAVGNIFSNGGGADLYELGGTMKNNLSILSPQSHEIQVLTNISHVFDNNVFIDPAHIEGVSGPTALTWVGGQFLGVLNGSLQLTNNIMANATVSPNATGMTIRAGTNNGTVTGNILYNWARTNTSTAFTHTEGSALTWHVSAQGSAYTDNSKAITAAASSNVAGNVDGQDYIVVTLPDTVGIPIFTGWAMFKKTGGPLQGPFYTFTIDSTHVEIFGTNYTSFGGSTFTGTLYFPWYRVQLTAVSQNCSTLPTMDILSVGGNIVQVGTWGGDDTVNILNNIGAGCHAGDTFSATPGSACSTPSLCGNGWSWNGSTNTGSGLQITLDTVTANTIGAVDSTGPCTLPAHNVTDTGGTNFCSFPDPNRTSGSYYATLAGSTANATFTGSIDSAGVLHVTAMTSGTLNLGDAITFSGQTKADYIKGNASVSNTLCVPGTGAANCTGAGGTGSYALTGINTSVGSGSMFSYAPQQLINQMRLQSKGNWKTTLTACAVNTYIKAGFGITDTCNVNQ